MITVFDIIIFTILFVSFLSGGYRGMIYIAINMLGFAASIIVAIFLYPYTYIILTEYIENNLASSVISGVFSYIFSLVIFTFLSSKAVLLFADISQGWFDRFLGFLTGIARGLTISILIFSFLAVFTSGVYTKEKRVEDIIYKLDDNKYPDWLRSSVTTPYMEDCLKKAINYIPQSWLDSVESFNKDDKKTDEINRIMKMEQNPIEESQLDRYLDENVESPLSEEEE